MEKIVNTPEEFICPITQQLMENPVLAADGHSYERSAIESWFDSGSKTSPLTNEELKEKHVIENLNLKKLINSFKEKCATDDRNKDSQKSLIAVAFENDKNCDYSEPFKIEELEPFKKLQNEVQGIKSNLVAIESCMKANKEEILNRFEEIIINKSLGLNIKNENNAVNNDQLNNELFKDVNKNKNYENINENTDSYIKPNYNNNNNNSSTKNFDNQIQNVIQIYPINDNNNELNDSHNLNNNGNNSSNDSNQPKPDFFTNLSKALFRKKTLNNTYWCSEDLKTITLNKKEFEVENFFEIREGLVGSYSTKKRTIDVWNLTNTNNKNESNLALKRLEVHLDNINKIITLKNGNFASCSEDKTIKIWNSENLNCFKTLKGHEESVTDLIELSDGKIASCSAEGVIKIWDILLNHNCISTFPAHLGQILCLFELDDGSLCTLGAGDKKIKIWRTKQNITNCLLKTFLTQTDFSVVIKMKYGFAGKLVCCNAEEIKVIDLLYGYFINIKNEFTQNVKCIVDLQNGKFASCYTDQGAIRIWDAASGECVDSLIGHLGIINGLLVLNSDKDLKLLSYGVEGVIRLWDYSNGESVSIANFANESIKTVLYLQKSLGKIICLSSFNHISDNITIHIRKFRKSISLEFKIFVTFVILMIIVFYLNKKPTPIVNPHNSLNYDRPNKYI